MDKLNKLGLLCVVVVLFAAGCGKKKAHKDTKANKKLTQSSIPLLKDTENLLDDSDIESFAFVDDEVLPGENDVPLFVENDETDLDGAANSDIPSAFAFQAVHFDFNKNDIAPEQAPVVQEDVAVAHQAVEQGKGIVVEGHCCQIGSATYNLALSQRRAEAVKAEMVKDGIASSTIKTVGYGYERPLVWSDATERGQLVKELSPNRRAEVLVN